MKKIKILTVILIIAVLTMIAFFGIYTHVQNRMENQVKDYEYAMDLKGTRNIRLKVNTENKTTIKDSEGKEVTDSDSLTDEELAQKGYTKEETPYNDESVLNAENYKKTKDILEKRLNKLNIDNYTIKLDEETGDIVLEIAESDDTDTIVSNINTVGKFEIIDSDTNEVLMDNSDIKLSNVMYGSGSSSTSTTSSGTTVYLNIEFTKNGASKLENISTEYTNTTSDNTTSNTVTNSDENTTTDSSSTAKKVTMKIDDEEIMSTSFDETLKTGKMQLSIGKASTDKTTIQGYVDQATAIATVLDTGNLPVKYDIDENKYVLSDITSNELQIVEYAILGIVIIALIVLIVRYKSFGFIGAISYIGLAAILVLTIRYANVILSLEGIFAVVLILILNYIFTNRILSKLQKTLNEKKINKEKLEKEDITNITKVTYKDFFIKIIPICITVITFCFIKWAPMSSFGMVMFWGILLIAIYNFIITNNFLKIKDEK